MIDAAFLETLRAAETGEGRFPEKRRQGLAGESDRLIAARNLVFAEGEGLDAHFEKLVSVAPGSPLVFCADRLRLLRRNRAGLKKAFEKENALTGPLFHALAAGPGPTLAKRNLAGSLDSPERVNLASDLRRALSERAYPVYLTERDWLKHIGPSRRVSKARAAWHRWRPKIIPVFIGVVVVVCFTFGVYSNEKTSETPTGFSGAPVTFLIWMFIIFGRWIVGKVRR